MIKNIIFDLGNVIIAWDSDRVYDKHFATVELKEEFYTTTGIKELNIELDRGLPFDTGLAELAQKHPQYYDSIWLWKHSWVQMLGKEIGGTLDIIQQLKAKAYSLYALTNWAAETFVYVENNFKWPNEFIDIVVSGREGLVKPDPAIFNLLLQRNNLNASECVFIDDSLANVKAANELGITGVHFKSPQQLLADLQQLHLL